MVSALVYFLWCAMQCNERQENTLEQMLHTALEGDPIRRGVRWPAAHYSTQQTQLTPTAKIKWNTKDKENLFLRKVWPALMQTCEGPYLWNLIRIWEPDNFDTFSQPRLPMHVCVSCPVWKITPRWQDLKKLGGIVKGCDGCDGSGGGPALHWWLSTVVPFTLSTFPSSPLTFLLWTFYLVHETWTDWQSTQTSFHSDESRWGLTFLQSHKSSRLPGWFWDESETASLRTHKSLNDQFCSTWLLGAPCWSIKGFAGSL